MASTAQNGNLTILDSNHRSMKTLKIPSRLIQVGVSLSSEIPYVSIESGPSATALTLYWQNPLKNQPGFLVRFCADPQNCSTDYQLIDSAALDAMTGTLELNIQFSTEVVDSTGVLQVIPIYLYSSEAEFILVGNLAEIVLHSSATGVKVSSGEASYAASFFETAHTIETSTLFAKAANVDSGMAFLTGVNTVTTSPNGALTAAITTPDIWYKDSDGDGYTTQDIIISTLQPNGYVITKNLADCRDDDASIYPGNGCGNGTFQTKIDSTPEYAITLTSKSIFVGDFNNDGKLDFAATNYDANTMSIWLGNGDGTFGIKTDYNTGAGPWDIIGSDFNSDGKQDLAVTNYHANTVSVWLGNGDGTFGTRTDYDTGVGPYSLLVRDFNKDSKYDLGIVNSNNDTGATVSMLLGN